MFPPWEVPAAVEVDTGNIERDLESRLQGALAKEFAGLCVQRVTGAGDPALKIVEFAHSNAVDLIMMPTHGFGLFRSLLLGSVTAKVLHDSKCPVWTATHAEEQRSPDMPRTILCAVDGTDKTAAQMQWAAAFGQRMGANVKLLHVVPPISDWLALPAERELQEEVREEARAKLESLRESAESSFRCASRWVQWRRLWRKRPGRKGPISSSSDVARSSRLWDASARTLTGSFRSPLVLW